MQKSTKTKSKISIPPKKAQSLALARPNKVSPTLPASIHLRHREYVDTFSSTFANFALWGHSANTPGYDLNPGCHTCFPWLSSIAINFEKFKFNRLTFELVPRNAATLSGAYYAAVDYDYNDALPLGATEFMANRGAVSGDAWTPLRLEVDIQRLNQDMPYRYVDAGARRFDSYHTVYGGFFMVAASGAAVAIAADLFVEYDVELTLPALHSTSLASTYYLPTAKTLAGCTKTGFELLPALQSLKTVILGLGGVPSVSTLGSVAAYEIPNLLRGTLGLTAAMATAASAPSAYAQDSKFSATLADAYGNVLTDNLPAVLNNGLTSLGPFDPAEWGIAGKAGGTQWVLPFDMLHRGYPTAKYIIPHITSTAGRVLAATVSYLFARFNDV